MALTDSSRSYGTVSRVLHWTMAALLFWQFGGMILKMVLGRVPLMAFWVGTHASVGALLLLVLMLRAGWAFTQKAQRPPYEAGLIGRAAMLGHYALYTLMFVIPFIALLRMAGSGKGVTLFGVQLQHPHGQEVEWMTAPGNALHGNLAWVLLALVAGHVLMVLLHRFLWRDDVLSRMAGTPA
ncbi:cytochrome b [Altererythrobacter xixiisoli]|uniref:Cytochrome b n=2 Tax=Croceibacterium xixiisoli TaxID=1476466 RepID=A0A6I4TN75_9SPHN|nr:cytochrome b [Croceibacterium xixiisoli]MXO97515.1 cytochrome b [Croceibacterium xixiisoli]